MLHLILLLWTSVLKKDGTPKSSLIEIFKIIKVDSCDTEELNTFAQKNFLRPKGKERWEVPPSIYENKKRQLMPLLIDLGMIYGVYPKKKHYDYIIIHGALLSTMEKRIAFLEKIIPELTYQKIYFITGPRKLDKNIEIINCDTEDQAAQILINRSSLKGKIELVSATKFAGPRPTTKDTIEKWLETKPKSGTILAISNNPFIPFQDAVFKAVLKKEGWMKNKYNTLETVGPPATNFALNTLLDSLARTLYSELKAQ